MKRIFICLLLAICATTGFAQQGNLLSTPYTPAVKKATVAEHINAMSKQTGIPVSFSDATINANKPVRLKGNESTIGDVLNTILSGTDATILERTDKILIISENVKKKSHGQLTNTINGYVKDGVSKEVLIGAVVYLRGTGIGAITNSYGYYSLTLPPGRHTIVCSYIGYTNDTLNLLLAGDNRQDLLLQQDNKLKEVTIVGKTKQQGGKIQLTANDINARPALLGETDVMRALQNVSGVQCGVDGSSSVLVRGGDPGQNLNLLDGVPIYYVDHFFGVTSIFNSEAVKSVDFYKGAFPAKYGGRLSSIIDVNTKDGDMQSIHGQFNMGLIKGSLNLEGPIIKDKASFMVSARRTWTDLLWRPFTNELGLNFYDVNVKGNYIVDKNNRLYVSLYNGADKVRYSSGGTNNSLTWANSVGSVKWNRIITPKLFVNTIATYSQFTFKIKDQYKVATANGEESSPLISNAGSSTISDAALKIQAQWYPNAGHSINTGLQYTFSKFVPVALEDPSFLSFNPTTSKFNSNEVTLFAEDEIKLDEKWTLRPGLHWANWISTNYNYSSLQPRMYIAYRPKQNHLLFASFSQMSQFLHSINNSLIGLQSDFWLPSTDKLRPEEALMGTLGYTANLKKNFDYNIEVYYKDIQDITMPNPGNNIFDNTANWDDKVLQGDGWSYGAEFSAQKKLGRFHVSTAYTLSWSWRKFDLLNSGKTFPYRYDRRHNLKAALTYKSKKGFSATANWTYMSGEAMTVPDQAYPEFDNNLYPSENGVYNSSSYIFTYSSINSYRLPAIHRLDVGFDFIKKKRKSERTWSVGVFNAYAHKNILMTEIIDVGQGNFKVRGTSIFQFIPYVSYKLKF